MKVNLQSAAAAAARLLPPVDIDGPKVRLGLAWAAVTGLAVVAGPVSTSLVFGFVALGAAGQACRSWKGQARRPYRPVAVIGATACALAGWAGPVATTATALAVAAAGLAAGRLRPGNRDWDAPLTVAIAVLLGVAGASPAIIRGQLGAVPAVVFLAMVHVVDAATFIVGSGARNRWEGPVAGAASAGAIGLAAAAVLVPPFRGASPWVLAATAALLVPAGAMAATALVGRADAPVPLLRRLDSYLAAGAVWALLGWLLLDVA